MIEERGGENLLRYLFFFGVRFFSTSFTLLGGTCRRPRKASSKDSGERLIRLPSRPFVLSFLLSLDCV